ncbi:MAG: membrane dipeptidase [Bacilli bacterium]|nr:membrane dipeptidase [Bacilli bacterium]
MKIFDIHSDLLYDLYIYANKGVHNRFKTYHVPKFRASSVCGGIWTLYSPSEFDLLTALRLAITEIDLELIPDFQIILGLEGLRNLYLEDLEEIYRLGIRHAMLTWNEENIYATGVKGDPSLGLTKLGKNLLSRMENLGMIIDLAHLNEKSFYDVLNYTNNNIIFSHGNLREFCDVSRNLSLDQMKALKEADGLLGLTLVGDFISSNPAQQNIDVFLNHLEGAIQVMGIDNLAFGFDFMDYFPNNQDNLQEIPDITYLDLLIERMRKRGFRDEEIKKIAYDNFHNRYRNKIVYEGAKYENHKS